MATATRRTQIDRYHDLVDRQSAGVLTETESSELGQLIRTFDDWDRAKTEALQLRNEKESAKTRQAIAKARDIMSELRSARSVAKGKTKSRTASSH